LVTNQENEEVQFKHASNAAIEEAIFLHIQERFFEDEEEAIIEHVKEWEWE
jgi:hypothetical protein